MQKHTTSYDDSKMLERMLRMTTPFDATEYVTSPVGRYGFLLEALEPPVRLDILIDALEVVARSAGGIACLEKESGVPQADIEHAMRATSIDAVRQTIHALLEGLRQYLPASQQVA